MSHDVQQPSFIQEKFHEDASIQILACWRFRVRALYGGKSSMQIRADGKTDRMDMTQEGKWLGANCGNLKPRR